MSDAIEYPAGLFTPAETPILPSHQVTPTPFTSGHYPIQIEGAPELGLAGEQRGFFSTGTRLDLHDHVIGVVGVARGQQVGELLLELRD